MEWNDGTIFRIYVNSGPDGPYTYSDSINAKVDIAQQELTDKVFIGVENFVLKPRVADPVWVPDDPAGTPPAFAWPAQDELQTYWANTGLIQLESVQLQPYIDYSSYNGFYQDRTTPVPLTVPFDDSASRNTTIFARIPLIATPTLGGPNLTTGAMFALDRVINKDSVLTEMRNNPLAVSNGRLRFRLLDQNGHPIPFRTQEDGGTSTIGPRTPPLNYIESLSFTIVIYKPNNRY